MASATRPDETALRNLDPDRYLSTLYAPADKRDALETLYLFNAEIAAIRDRTTEPMPGEIRIQWWRDAIAAGHGQGHPLAERLVGVIAAYGLPADAFDRYLEARIFDLYDDAMPTRADLEGYCGETASTVIQLAALILEPEAAPTFATAAGHAGCAQAIAGLLRLLPIHRARGQCYVPTDILAAAGTDRDGYIGGEDREALRRAAGAMVALAREHVAAFEMAAHEMPATLRPAFLPAGLASAYLDRIASPGFDPFAASADISAIRRHATMLFRAMRGWG